MNALPIVLVSSVVRSANQGESHGALYLLDLATEVRRHCVDWNTCEINWAGRGLDRRLRRISFQKEEITATYRRTTRARRLRAACPCARTTPQRL